MALRVTWRDALAVIIALSAVVASVALWSQGRVSIGLELAEGSDPNGYISHDGSEEPTLPGVFVESVTPDGNAARHGIYPGSRVVSLTTVDGEPVAAVSTVSPPGVGEVAVHSEFGEATTLPIEAIPAARVAGIIVGEVYEEGTFEGDSRGVVTYGYANVERQWLEHTLGADIYAVALGILVALVSCWLLVRGLFGEVGRREAPVASVAVVLPLLLVPVVEVGNLIGIVATWAATLAVALLLGLGLADRLPRPGMHRAGLAVAGAAASVAALIVLQHMTTPDLSPDERGPIAVLHGAIALGPGLMVGITRDRTGRERASAFALGLLPTVGLLAILPSDNVPVVPLFAFGVLATGLALPWERLIDQLAADFRRIRSASVAPDLSVAPIDRERRDLLTVALVGFTLFMALAQGDAWAVVLASAVGLVIWIGLRQGVFGIDWTDAAVPVAASVAIPILLLPSSWWSDGSGPAVIVPAAFAAVSVAHLLASRHSEPALATRLFLASVGLAALLVLSAVVLNQTFVPLIGLVPLIPGIPVAFADRTEPRAVAWRIETLAVAITPLIALFILVPRSGGELILAAWLAAIVVWRYVALNPLIGLAQRTQLQRDLAVAAAETERARLAADLHDDALQQLTMLVRTLDERGDKETADEAREIATKLRSVVGDLRLPILDDLGAGAALEWLVERVEPLAGGPVKLERSDATRPPASVELAVFRVAQEAITNAIKHGRAPIAVRYDVRSDGRVTLAVDDAGPGIGPEAAEEAPRQGHFGLANMQQRAEQIGALLDVRRWPAGGTRVALEWRPQ